MEFFATCPTGFEQLLAHELGTLHTPRLRPLKGRVSFEGTLADAYRVCLWSHLASRVIVVLERIGARDAEELYAQAVELAWEDHLPTGTPFAIDATGSNQELRNTQFIALKTKDAIADRIQARTGVHPLADPKAPGLRVIVRVSRERALVGIDLTGEPLFRRGYEAAHGSRTTVAPLRPDYAAALLAMGGWDELCKAGHAQALVPYSGAGILAVEAALQALDRAPGTLRTRWAATHWAGHNAVCWDELVAEAHERAEQGAQQSLTLLLSDQRPGCDRAARQALRSAGIDIEPRWIGVHSELSCDSPALLACDLSWIDESDMASSAAALSRVREAAAHLASGSRASLLASRTLSSLPLGPADRTLPVLVGRSEAHLMAFDEPQAADHTSVTLPSGDVVHTLLPTSDQFAARLAKVAKQRRKWARREDVSCYRIYDSDLPDYAVSIDLFEGSETPGRWLQIFEYAPPKSVDPALARARLLDVVAIAPRILDAKPVNTFVRVRTKARGGSQYAQEALSTTRQRPGRAPKGKVPLPPGAHLVDEGGLTFEVNFTLHLDCGIFLDHRETRSMLREMAKQTKGSKRFLNLFAYTGTASCYAADGGMRYTTTVDLSRPSLDWARRNMERNGFAGPQHEFVQADVIAWVNEQRHTRNRWDLIFCDVPTFSNSQRMRSSSFDVQRDHAELLIGVSRLLMRGGTCVFSCNLRSFKLDEQALAKAGVEAEDITAQTIPEDFSRNPRIHRCYLIRRTPRA